jgi:pimeloyl-ACP methyl ester carboxylesterase
MILNSRIAVVLALLAAAASASDWRVSLEPQPVDGAVDVLETIWVAMRPPEAPHDCIQLHQYRSAAIPEGGASRAALLYLPGTNMNGEVAVAEEDHNLWIFLARRGVDVYALDYRTHSVPPSELADSRFMSPWTLAAFIGDAQEALALIRRQSESPSLLFVAGFSRGVWLAYGLVATEPAGSLSGMIALDGAFKSYRPKERNDFDKNRKAFSDRGRWASDVAAGIGWETRDSLMKAAGDDPAGPALGEGFDSVGEQVASILQNAWRPGGLANPLGGKSSPEILARLLEGYDRYYPAIQNLESAAIADYDDHPGFAIDDRWGELELPILYFGATNMGADWLLDGIYSALKSGSSDVEILVLEDYGHLDVLVGDHARKDVFEPILTWTRARAETP